MLGKQKYLFLEYFFQQIFQNQFSILSPIHTITLYSTTHLGSFFFTQPPPPVPRSFKIGQGGNLENIHPDISTGKGNGKGLSAISKLDELLLI